MMGIITTTKSEDILKELTQHRCMSSVPFGGRYRMIDFTLSNMVNSGIHNIGVITSHKYRSLMDHLGAGKEWGLDRKSEGLMILPSASPSIFKKNIRFDLKDLYENYEYLEKSRQKYLLLTGNNMICNINYKDALQFHLKNNAQVTVFYKEEICHEKTINELGFWDVEADGRVTGFHLTPSVGEKNKVSLEMIIMERELLMDMIQVAHAMGNWDLADILAANLNDLRIYAYQFKGYLAKINSVESYYKCNMELLDPDVWYELFFKNGPIYTKIKDGPPTKYADDAKTAKVLVGTGCKIMGNVENSILFRGVTIGRGASVKNSIIMQKTETEENVVLENVILDKEVRIRKGTILKGGQDSPIVIAKKSVI